MKHWTLAAWCMMLVCAVLAILAQQARGEPARYTLGVDHLSIEAFTIERNADPYMPDIGGYSNDPEYWSHGAAINWDVTLAKYDAWRWYWRNVVHTSATNRQVRHVGWQWDLGIGYRDKVEAFYWHHSQHAVDAPSNGAYPLIDRYGVRVIFIP